jgi:hypothetical protein
MDEELIRAVRARVADGFGDWRAVVGDLEDEFVYGDVDATAMTSDIMRLVAQEWDAHVKAQQDWPEITDCDRLDAAFVEINRAQIVARHNFACCQNCGVREIGAEMAAVPGARGYTFYHYEDTEAVTRGGALYLAFGGEHAGSIARDVVAVLARHGLTTEWGNDANTRIQVKLNWQRRREPLPILHAKTSSGRPYVGEPAAMLHELLDAVATREEDFFVLEKPRATAPQRYAQAARAPEGGYAIEYRDGSASRHFRAVTDDRDAAYSALLGWTNDQPKWADRLRFSQLSLD